MDSLHESDPYIYETTPVHSNYKYNKWQKILPQASSRVCERNEFQAYKSV